MPLKVAILGCGKIGWTFQDDPGAARFGVCTHAAAWSAIEGVELIAVADAVPVSARGCAARWSVPLVYDGLDSLLAGCSPEIVSIATPDALHYSAIKRCLEAPSVAAVLAEKPLALSTAEVVELAASAQRLGKHIIVNYSRRFCDFYIGLQKRIHANEFGPLTLARNVYTKGMRHNGSHFLDLMRYFFGEVKPHSSSRPGWLARDSQDTDPGLDAHLSTASGASVVLHHLPAGQFTVFEMDLCFEKARFIFTDGGDTVQEFALVKDQPFAGYTGLAQTVQHRGAMHDYLRRAAENVVSILRDDAPNLSPPSESVALFTSLERLSQGNHEF